MKYYFYATIGLIGTMFGIGFIEDPYNNLLVGIGILYGSFGLLCYSLMRIAKNQHNKI